MAAAISIKEEVEASICPSHELSDEKKLDMLSIIGSFANDIDDDEMEKLNGGCGQDSAKALLK
jgi:hypothetical protein